MIMIKTCPSYIPKVSIGRKNRIYNVRLKICCIAYNIITEKKGKKKKKKEKVGVLNSTQLQRKVKKKKKKLF